VKATGPQCTARRRGVHARLKPDRRVPVRAVPVAAYDISSMGGNPVSCREMGVRATEAMASDRQLRHVVLIAAVVVLSTCVPYAYYYIYTPPDRVFSGAVENVLDQNTYFMWIGQVREGKLLAHNLFTTEPHPPMLPSLPWVAVGLVSRWCSVDPVVPYHALRLVAGFGYLVLFYAIAVESLPNTRAAFLAFLIVSFGSGLGLHMHLLSKVVSWMAPASADEMPELWAYHSILVMPHFALSLLALAVVVLAVLRGRREQRWMWPVTGFLGMATLAHVHPYTAVVVIPLLVVWAVVIALHGQARRAASVVAATASGALPAAGLMGYYYVTNPVARSWAGSAHLASPPVIEYVVGFGLVIPLALLGVTVALRRRPPSAGQVLFLVWIVVGAAALYSSPLIPFERRCVEGLHLPLAMMAGLGLDALLGRWASRITTGARPVTMLLSVLLFVLLFPTNAGLQLRQMHNPGRTIPRAWVDGFRLIKRSSAPTDSILCPLEIGNSAARYALRPVYLGHTYQTIHFQAKSELVATFFSPEASIGEMSSILRRTGARFVISHQPVALDRVLILGLEPILLAPGFYSYDSQPAGSRSGTQSAARADNSRVP